VTELAVDGVPVAVTCRVLKLARQPYYRWLADPITDTEVVEAYRANALFDAHKDDPEFGHRLLADEARDAGEPMADRTAWRICAENGWWSVFGKKKRGKGKRPGPPVHDDLVGRDFTADAPERTLAGRHHRAQNRRGQALPLRDQGRVLEPDRRLLHRLADEVTPGRHSAGERRRSAR